MKLAFIGTGKIIQDALGAVTPIKNLEKTAVFARPHSIQKARDLADQHNIPEVYTDYQELLANTAADTVYIGLINSAHYPYAKEALLHGKNVILEKPLTGYYDQAEELFALAKEKGLFVLEAITIMHGEFFYEMKKNVAKLGPIRMVLGNYSQYSSRYDAYLQGEIPHAFDPAFYGGALFDINIYNIYYCVGLFGLPKSVSYFANFGPNRIDTSGTIVLAYDGFTASLTGAKDSDSPCFVSVQGEKGWMHLNGKPNTATLLKTVYADPENKETVRDAAGAMVRPVLSQEYEESPAFHRMTPEFEDFTRIIDEKDYAEADRLAAISLQVMKVLEEGRKMASLWE
ncbi:MAG: Gfo/Idh/MocA family oxidoreductase [Firmicutes bacterium]|nr:Gfo/Idh/MocA family oxidoreductase [Bacillota bacterium]